MASYGQRYFSNPVYEEIGSMIFKYHGYGMMVSIFVLVWVFYMGCYAVFWRSYIYRHFKGWQRLEYWWTIFPMILLGLLWVPSMKNLYLMNLIKTPIWSFKAVGSQWYWSYEFNLSDFDIFEFQSYMLPDSGKELNSGYRLLDVDWRMVAPAETQMTIYVTSTDVIHSFALPSAFVKADGIPGRINQIPLKVNQCCILYGQCSEICGVNHSFMPIVIEFIPFNLFVQYINSMKKHLLYTM